MSFSVWAPKARRVRLVLPDREVSLEPAEQGWFGTDVEVPSGTDYRFRLNDSEALPDPRSPWQPDGVHGPSRTVDHGAYRWRDDDWDVTRPLGAWVLYELHVGTFTPEGTFDAAIGKLSHLVDLGIDAVEVMPVNAFSGNHGWGYDGVALYAPHQPYGGPDGFKRFVDACHSVGLAVVLDVVYNHLGPSGNYLGRYGHYFTDAYSTPWGDAVNFDDAHSDHVRTFFIDNALMWFRDYHVDALRLDAIHAILDTSALHFLEQLRNAVARLAQNLGRSFHLIAESDLNDPRIIWPLARGGYGIDAQWSDDFHHALHSVLTGERNGYYEDFGSLPQLATAFERAYVYAGEYSPYRRRKHGRAPGVLEGARFLAYLQNHDQVGNRAAGERTSHLLDTDLLKVGSALVLTSPFIPMLFQGEEWGASSPFQYFTDHPDPELGRAVSEGRRKEFAAFGWDPADVPDPQDPATFERSRLHWAEVVEAPHADLLAWHRALISLRRATPALHDGDLSAIRVECDEAEGRLVITRKDVTVVCNLSDRELVLTGSLGKLLLASRPPVEGAHEVRIPPRSVGLWQQV